MSERTYIDDIVTVIMQKGNHRKLVLKEAERRILDEVERLFKRIIEQRDEKDKEWWKNKLILKNPNKDEIVWFAGLNTKTVKNILGTTRIDECRALCAENYDAVVALVGELPKDFPEPLINIVYERKTYQLTKHESFMLIRTLMAMVKTVTGGIWSEVGKNAGDEFLRRVFAKLGIREGPLGRFMQAGLYFELNVVEEERPRDAVIYYKGKRVCGLEIKILGAGNPEIVDEAISRLGRGDVFIVDQITDLMKKKTEEKGIIVIELKDALEKLYDLFKSKGLPVKSPNSQKD
jgi:hypothetical protein